ncbi:MAG TPA: serine hydrolase domain-containing protein [Candidatus Polarisedimenticolaceae bacterium]|nr:serine hydrolase domain-containing protein [Candidatus Polarisedimenticolaceae bacterium]
MLRRLCAAAAAVLLLSALPARAERVDKDTPSATPGGATFTIPGGWSTTTRDNMVILEPPEPDTHIALVDVAAKDAEAAVTAAWAAYKPGFARPLKIAQTVEARQGWDERKVFQYETSPNERVVVQALALRAGEKWTVLLIDGTEPTFEKRGAPAGLALASVRPGGYTRESFAGKKANPLDEKRQAVLKDFLLEGMKMLDVPGVGLAFLDGGKVVWAGGLGVKELGKPAPVGADTLFMAASNTKALTTLLLAELVDEGKMRWDQPVTELFPDFKLGDEATTRQVKVEHLICACTGMPRQDLEWLFEYKNQTPQTAMKLLGTMQPTTGFGEVFQYSNLMAAAAGFIGGAKAVPGTEWGKAYDQAMKKKVFEPLGMTRTTFDYPTALKGDVALPHGDDVDGKVRRDRMEVHDSIYPVRPAGGVWTSPRDLAQYVQMELARGMLPGGKRLVSEKNLLARYEKKVALGEDATYGMALMVDKRYGVSVVHHGGDLPGYHSDMMWLPEYGVGAVILTNADSGVPLRGLLQRRLLEVLFDGKPEAEENLKGVVERRKAAIAKERERLVVPADPELVARLGKRYSSKELGEVKIVKEGGATVFDTGEWKSAVASRKNDDGTVSFITIEPAVAGFEFVVSDKDGKRRLVTRDAQHEYVFVEGTGTKKN